MPPNAGTEPSESPREGAAAVADRPRELFLIDGNSLAYRAFFALPESIATSKGMPTNAIFGFASMLVKIRTEHGPRATLVVWDAGMSGREEVSDEYKAQRRPRPDLLSQQWPHLAPLVEAFGYRNIKVPGYEADDVIATLARRAREQGIEVMAVTGDRDALQLVEPGVRVMTTSRGITDTRVYDRDAVLDRYGIPPELVPDFIGLKGDTSDNIPGVPGIGDKTAAELLQRFGDLETVLSSIDEISGKKRKENLADHAEDARVSKRLATAIRDVDVDIDLEDTVAAEPDRSRLREAFREFELRDPLQRLEEAFGERGAAPETPVAEELVARATEVPVADLARVEGDPAALVAEPADGSLRFAAYGGGGEVATGEAETLPALELAWGERPVVAHDWKSIASGAPSARDPWDGPAPGAVPAPVLEHDTMVAAYLLDPSRRRYPLAELSAEEGLAARVEGVPEDVPPEPSDGQSTANGTGAADSEPPSLRTLAERAVVVRTLAERQRHRIDDAGLDRLFREVELPLVEVLVAMERAGIKLDADRLGEVGHTFADRIAGLEGEIWELAGEEFTIGSPQQLGVVLFERLGLSKKRRGKTGFSTDARVLAAIRSEHPIVGRIETWRELTKLKSTYLDALPESLDPSTLRLHTTFNQTATTTGRLSSTNPNLQNIPIRTEIGRAIRACFVADEGSRLISADYSQVELRLLAHIAGEDVLRDIFRRGEDVHAATAAEIFDIAPEEIDPGIRSQAKMVNFGIVYGLGVWGLSDRLQIPMEEAGEFIERYLGRFPAVRAFIEETIARATTDGYVTTLFGRIRRIPELRERSWQQRELGKRLAVNTVIQGTAADIIKVAMVRCHRAVRDAGLATRLVLQIHDELLFEAPHDEMDAASRIVRDEMAGAFEMDPPLAVDLGVGDNWLDAK
jgi:DNA polymerase I